ncbi:hypothetical protein SASPL_109228 [Salvia splendens]|uniref:Uncharacterized protein n=1 Tax=Salvia splendens TaxID=180675 RepID=A0A8X8YEI6_SALSN|nr:hypothetical protein SASPL_109228 [Salvia splendens]
MLQPSKGRILDNTVNYIKCLQEEAERLEGLKKFQSKLHRVERPSLSKCTDHNSANLTISDSAVFLAIQLPSRQGSVLNILRVLQRHEAEVMEAWINVSDEKVMTFTATMKLGAKTRECFLERQQERRTSCDRMRTTGILGHEYGAFSGGGEIGKAIKKVVEVKEGCAEHAVGAACATDRKGEEEAQ